MAVVVISVVGPPSRGFNVSLPKKTYFRTQTVSCHSTLSQPGQTAMGKQNHCIYRILLMTVMFVGVSLEQNPLEDFRDSVMTAVTSITDSISKGGAVRQEHGIKTVFSSINSEIQGGIGDAVGSESSRRKRRSIDFSNERQLLFQPLKTIAQSHMHRMKRAPCHGGGGGGGNGGGGNGGDGDGADGAEEIASSAQRRRQAAQQRKRSTTTNNKRNSLKGRRKLINEDYQNSRRRRQAESYENDDNKSKISEIADNVAQRIREGVDSFKNSMKEMAQTVRETFNG